MCRLARLLLLALLLSGGVAHSADWIASPEVRITRQLHDRLELYLQAINAPPEEQKKLEAQDPANGIWLMQRNAFLRARLQLVGLLTPREREELLSGRTFRSEPYAKLPKKVQGWMGDALGVDRLDPAVRDATGYLLRRTHQDGAHFVMISRVDPHGRPTSGGSVMPGIVDPPPATKPRSKH